MKVENCSMNEFEEYEKFCNQVLEDAWRMTGSKTWDDVVIDWFWRMDFDPSSWQIDYLEFVKNK